jgi:hypothetical protein
MQTAFLLSTHLFEKTTPQSFSLRHIAYKASFVLAKMKTITVFLLALGLAVASAQPTCRVYKTFNAVANTGMVQDTIVVPDTFPVGSARVSNLVLGHPDVASLQMTLLQRPTANDAFTESALAPAADQVGSYTPQAAMNAGQPATGQYVLRITDSQPGAEG